MVTDGSSKMLEHICQTTRLHISEDSHLSENFTSRIADSPQP